MKFEFASSQDRRDNLYRRMASHQVKSSIARGNQKYGAAVGAALFGNDDLNDEFLNSL